MSKQQFDDQNNDYVRNILQIRANTDLLKKKKRTSGKGVKYVQINKDTRTTTPLTSLYFVIVNFEHTSHLLLAFLLLTLER